MRLTPGQIAELRSDGNVRGFCYSSATAGMAVLYRVVVDYATLERAQVLANNRTMPPTVWYVAGPAAARVEIHTTNPEWFAELQEMIADARRPRPT